MNATEINNKKQVGDFATAAAMLGITTEAARMLFKRPEAERHSELCNAMAEIIESRDALIENAKNNKEVA